MNLAQEIDTLHDLSELVQKLRAESQREGARGVHGTFTDAHEAAVERIVQTCRLVVEKAGQ